ncbi:hypothetical protein SUGI_0998320 [Cryptomeria japonica]|nr:hypothetical protein SUGI_0998320 [Cryptomeria japonica]
MKGHYVCFVTALCGLHGRPLLLRGTTFRFHLAFAWCHVNIGLGLSGLAVEHRRQERGASPVDHQGYVSVTAVVGHKLPLLPGEGDRYKSSLRATPGVSRASMLRRLW